jgi:hypothetical protein
MARTPNQFIDPRTSETYDWPINHHTEESMGKKRNIRHSAPTMLTGLNRQQGAPDPLILRWTGTILTRAQHQAFLAWYTKCDTQTIHVVDFHGNRFEVIITNYDPKRRSVLMNRHDPVNAPNVVWDYTIEMEVVTVVSGDWVGVAP